MSAAVFNEAYRHEPYRLPAGVMALAVHGVFFALLYFGFSWQSVPLEMVRVDLWQSLPETVAAPVEQPRVEEVVQPVQQEKVAEPEIALPEKKKVEAKRAEEKPVKKKAAAKPVGKQAVEQKPIEPDQDLLIEQQQAERVRAEQAEQAEAKGRMVNEYKAKIQNKITRNIVVELSGVPDDALAIFRVTLLPDGSVLSAIMKKPSGNAAYDNAVERAILKSVPLPLPPDVTMFKEFRILELKFQPKK